MKSGVPIKGVVLLRTNTDPVIIARKKLNPTTGKMVRDPNPRTARVYIGGNNHHVEIREHTKKRKGETVAEWAGKVVKTFYAAKRNADRLKALKDAGVPSSKKLRQMSKAERKRFAPIVADVNKRFPVVDRSDNDAGNFVMSLAEGEMIFARRWNPKNKQPVGSSGYFVVCKCDPNGRIHFAPHWDARSASEQDRWSVTPSNLKKCGEEPGKPPYKVRVSPLGEVRRLERD